MLEDGDRVLNLVGVLVVLGVLAAGGVVALNFDRPGGDDAGPTANWSVERVDDTQVRITHAGGDPVRTEEIRVTVDSVSRDTNWTDPVTPGENTTVPASEGAMVRVVWLGGRGNRVVMERWRV